MRLQVGRSTEHAWGGPSMGWPARQRGFPRRGPAARPRPGRPRRRPAPCRRCGPLRKAKSSTPSTRGARSGTGGAVSSASSRLRPAVTRSSRHSRSPARPPNSTAIDRNHAFKPRLDLRYRSVSPPTCSTEVLLEQLLRSQKYLRTRNRITTRLEPSGRSARPRRYELWTRRARHRQSGHRPGRHVDTASTTNPSSDSLTCSTRTPTPENSTSSTDLTAMRRKTAKKGSGVPLPDLGFQRAPPPVTPSAFRLVPAYTGGEGLCRFVVFLPLRRVASSPCSN
ncbi:hypothetical protein SUDANB145_02226 [Streptomyces sp. enrichment culture]